MKYTWPSPQSDPAVEAVIARFQECRNGCGIQVDVVTGQRHSIRREGNLLVIDGCTYRDVATWVRGLKLAE